jgi:hypothetical protein
MVKGMVGFCCWLVWVGFGGEVLVEGWLVLVKTLEDGRALMVGWL